MQITTVLTTLLARAIAVPLAEPQSGASDTWKPSPNTKTTCDKTSDKTIDFNVGPKIEDVINDACAAMMPVCAYPDRGHKVFCIETIDFRLPGPASSTQKATVETKEGSSLSGWDVKFSVAPPPHSDNDPPIFWTAKDCYGYFHYLLNEWEDKGGCLTNEGSGVGSLTAGTGNSLAGTKFDVTIVKAE